MKAKPKTVRISFQGDTALSLATVKLKMLVILAKRQPDDLPFSAKRLRVERVEKPRGKRLGRGEIERLREIAKAYSSMTWEHDMIAAEVCPRVGESLLAAVKRVVYAALRGEGEK